MLIHCRVSLYCNITATLLYTAGMLESQEHVFTWNMVSNYEADLEEAAFTFQYSREGKEPRWVKVFSPYVSTDVSAL